MIVHATLIARHRGGGWRGLIVRGPSGAGKSDLALRALRAGWRLVADDRVRLWTSGGGLFGAAPANLAGLVEARGVGVVQVDALPFAPVLLVVDACERPERLPAAVEAELLGVRLPALALPLREASVLSKLELALEGVIGGASRRPL